MSHAQFGGHVNSDDFESKLLFDLKCHKGLVAGFYIVQFVLKCKKTSFCQQLDFMCLIDLKIQSREIGKTHKIWTSIRKNGAMLTLSIRITHVMIVDCHVTSVTMVQCGMRPDARCRSIYALGEC